MLISVVFGILFLFRFPFDAQVHQTMPCDGVARDPKPSYITHFFPISIGFFSSSAESIRVWHGATHEAHKYMQ